MVTIKFDKQIEDCRECPFFRTKRSRGLPNRHGKLAKIKTVCEKIGDILEHDYEKDDVKFEIPNRCPFNTVATINKGKGMIIHYYRKPDCFAPLIERMGCPMLDRKTCKGCEYNKKPVC